MDKITANYYRAMKSINLTKIKSILRENQKQMSEIPEEHSPDSQKFNELLTSLTQIREQHRNNEFYEIFTKGEEFYLDAKFHESRILVGFAKSLTKKSGFADNLQKSLSLEKKVNLSLVFLDELKKLEIENPQDLVPVVIQKRYAKIENLLKKAQKEEERQDTIHPSVIKTILNVRDKLTKFMDKYNIDQLSPLQLESKSFWTNTKTSINLVSSEMKLNHLINNAQKVEGLPEKQEYLVRAYKLVQENPNLFSVEQKQSLVSSMENIEKQIHVLGGIAENVLDSAISEMENFNFTEAHKKLEKYRNDLVNGGLVEQIIGVDEMIIKVEINRGFYRRLEKVEQIYTSSDVLGAKTELLYVQDEINNYESPDLILTEVYEYLNQLRSQLKGEKVVPSVVKTSVIELNGSSSSEEEFIEPLVELFQQFKAILQKYKKISRQDLADRLHLTSEEIFDKLLAWKEKIPFQFISGYIVLPGYDISDADSEDEESEEDISSDAVPERKYKKPTDEHETKEQEALEALDDLLYDN
jgi:hypothetical protein